MEEGVVRSRFGHFRSFLEVCVVVFVTHVSPIFLQVPFFDTRSRVEQMGNIV